MSCMLFVCAAFILVSIHCCLAIVVSIAPLQSASVKLKCCSCMKLGLSLFSMCQRCVFAVIVGLHANMNSALSERQASFLRYYFRLGTPIAWCQCCIDSLYAPEHAYNELKRKQAKCHGYKDIKLMLYHAEHRPVAIS